MNERGRVIVRGSNIMLAPLLDSPDANMVEIYDAQHNLVAFLARIFTDDTWGLCTKDDPDWPEMCIRYGFSGLKPHVPPKEIISQGVRPFITGA